MVGRMGPGMRQVVGFGDRSTGGGNFEANVGHPIVTNVDFDAACPQITLDLSSIFRLHCRFHAEPEPRVMWLCNGAQVFASDHVTLSGNADQSQLTIHGATLLDTGEYVCSASNTLGQATTKTFLRVRSESVSL